MSVILENRLVHIAVVIVVAFILQFIAHHAIGPIVRKSVKRTKGETRLDEKKREDTIITIVRTTVIALIGLLALGSVLTILGVNVTALLTGAGIIGVFVGLSAQTTVKDLLAGIFILFEKQYRVGDIVTLSGGTTGMAGATGTVEEITLRITKLRDNSGRLITVRNGEPVVIINQTTSYSSIVLDINFTYESDISATQKIIDKVGVDLILPPEFPGRKAVG